jgi:uncharacterized protein YjbI with pentapeptide repeats
LAATSRAVPTEPDRLKLTPVVRSPSASCGSSHDPIIPVGADFLPYVGTSSLESARASTRVFSLNLLGGYASGLRGVELAGALNLERRYACGVQIAGVSNVVLGPVRGLSLSGAVNVSSAATGALVAGAANVTNGDLVGLQLTGAANIANGVVEGAQIGGVANFAQSSVTGLQLSGVVNLTPGRIDGAQISGVFNLATDEVRGLQLSTVNVASKRVRGVQIGVVNVAEKSDFSLGVVSINTKGRTHVDAWSAPEVGLFASAVKHGGDHWHGIYGFGTRTEDGKFLAILGFGGHARLNERLRLDVDALGYEQNPTAEHHEASLLQARTLLGFRVIDALTVFAGPSYNVLLSRRGKGDAAPSFAHAIGSARDPEVHVWPGAVVGIELLSDS